MRLLILFGFISSVAFGQVKGEYIKYNSSKINGIVPNQLATAELLRLLGKPTSIRKNEGECGLTEEQERAKIKNLYFYDSTLFIIFDNKAELYEVNFRNGRFTYHTDKIKLSNKTTLDDLQKIYPASIKASIKENNGTMVRIKPCFDCDGDCLLYFEKGMLVKLEWWEPC